MNVWNSSTARIRGTRLYLAIAIASAAFAFGSYTPVLRILWESGIVRSIRYPEKFILMGIFVVTVFGAIVGSPNTGLRT